MCLPEPTQGCSIISSQKPRLVTLHPFISQPHGINPFPIRLAWASLGSILFLSWVNFYPRSCIPALSSLLNAVANICAWQLVSVFCLRLSCPQKACPLTYLWSKISHAIVCDDHPSGLLGSVWADSGILKVVDCTLIQEGRGSDPAQSLEMLLVGCLTISRCWINVCSTHRWTYTFGRLHEWDRGSS